MNNTLVFKGKLCVYENKYKGLIVELNCFFAELDYDLDVIPFVTFILAHNFQHFVKTKQKKATIDGYPSYLNKEKDLKDFNLLLEKKAKKLFKQIQEFYKTSVTTTNEIDLILNAKERLIVYLLCKILKLNCKRIKGLTHVLIPCTDFLPCNKGKPRSEHAVWDYINYPDDDFEDVCGCNYAPSWFERNRHFDNNYEDTISYSKRLTKKTIGLKIINA